MEKSEVEAYLKAGEIAKEIKVFARNLIKPGMKLIDIAEAIDEKILELGGESAFPVNLGLNEYAAHYTPAPNDETIAEGILKIDFGVHIDGFIADTAISIDLTPTSEFKEMIELNEKVLAAATKAVRPNMKVRDVGDAVHEVMKEKQDKFAIIKTLCGHALDKNIIHTSPTISNYKNSNTTKLDDVAFAVEPFVTTGVGDIFEGKGGGIYVLAGDGAIRDRDARELVEFIYEEYETRPFCERWLVKAGFTRLKFILGMLVKQGVLYEYPVLVEKSRKPVSQVENTFLISDNKVYCTTG